MPSEGVSGGVQGPESGVQGPESGPHRSPTVAMVGEHALIARIRHRLPPSPDWLSVDIGDDAAVYEPVRNRLEVYHRQTEPLVEYYSKWAKTGDPKAPKYHRIDGLGKVEEVRDRIFAALG